MDKKEILSQAKRPVGLKKHVGIEIEFISPCDQDDIRDLICQMGLHANCTIKNDGSLDGYRQVKDKMPNFKHECQKPDWRWSTPKGIDNQGYTIYEYHTCSGCEKEDEWETKHGYDEELETHEITILTTEAELRPMLNKINVLMKKIKAEVNDTCGLHVHLDMRNRDFNKSIEMLMSKQKEMHKMVAKGRLKNVHCLPLKKKEIHAKTALCPRYRDINLSAYNKFGTVEVRVHEGCVNTAEIYNWCRYLIAVVDGRKVSKTYVKKRIMECA